MTPGRSFVSAEEDELEDESLVVHPTQRTDIILTDTSQSSSQAGQDDEAAAVMELLNNNKTQDVSASQVMWSARGILKENQKGYLIAWEGMDPDTGKDWKPTWEPKDCPTPDLIARWDEEKRRVREAGTKKRKSKGSTADDVGRKSAKGAEQETKQAREMNIATPRRETQAKRDKKKEQAIVKSQLKRRRIIESASEAETDYDRPSPPGNGKPRGNKNGRGRSRLPAHSPVAQSGSDNASPPPLSVAASVSCLPAALHLPRKSVAVQGISSSPQPKASTSAALVGPVSVVSQRVAGKQRAIGSSLGEALLGSGIPINSVAAKKGASLKSPAKLVLQATRSAPKLSNNASSNESVVPDSQAVNSLSPIRPFLSVPPLSTLNMMDPDKLEEEPAAVVVQELSSSDPVAIRQITKRKSILGKPLRPVTYPNSSDFQNNPPTSSFDPIEDADSSPNDVPLGTRTSPMQKSLIPLPPILMSQSTPPAPSQPIVNLKSRFTNRSAPLFKPFASPNLNPQRIDTIDIGTNRIEGGSIAYNMNGYAGIDFDDNFGKGKELTLTGSTTSGNAERPQLMMSLNPSVLTGTTIAHPPKVQPVDSPILINLRQQNAELLVEVSSHVQEILRLQATSVDNDRLVAAIAHSNQAIVESNAGIQRLQDKFEDLLEMNSSAQDLNQSLQAALEESEKNVNRLQEDLKQLQREHELLAKLSDDSLEDNRRVEMEDKVERLTKEHASLQADKETALEDGEYLRAQYQEASSKAALRGREAQAAEAKVKGLETALDLGLRQRDLFQSSQQKMMQIEIDRLKLEAALLKEESRRTNTIRTKAAKWEAHVANEELRMIEIMRQRREQEEVEMRETETLARRDSIAPTLHPDQIPSDGLIEAAEGSSDEDDEDDPFVFECLWRDGNDVKCDTAVESRELLQDHITVVHIHENHSSSPTLQELQFEEI